MATSRCLARRAAAAAASAASASRTRRINPSWYSRSAASASVRLSAFIASCVSRSSSTCDVRTWDRTARMPAVPCRTSRFARSMTARRSWVRRSASASSSATRSASSAARRALRESSFFWRSAASVLGHLADRSAEAVRRRLARARSSSTTTDFWRSGRPARADMCASAAVERVTPAIMCKRAERHVMENGEPPGSRCVYTTVPVPCQKRRCGREYSSFCFFARLRRSRRGGRRKALHRNPSKSTFSVRTICTRITSPMAESETTQPHPRKRKRGSRGSKARSPRALTWEQKLAHDERAAAAATASLVARQRVPRDAHGRITEAAARPPTPQLTTEFIIEAHAGGEGHPHERGMSPIVDGIEGLDSALLLGLVASNPSSIALGAVGASADGASAGGASGDIAEPGAAPA